MDVSQVNTESFHLLVMDGDVAKQIFSNRPDDSARCDWLRQELATRQVQLAIKVPSEPALGFESRFEGWHLAPSWMVASDGTYYWSAASNKRVELPSSGNFFTALNHLADRHQGTLASVTTLLDSLQDLTDEMLGNSADVDLRHIVLPGGADAPSPTGVDNGEARDSWHQIYWANSRSIEGLIEGCRWFELFDPLPPDTNGLGATPLTSRRCHFRVWAPRNHKVEVEVTRKNNRAQARQTLTADEDGFFSGVLEDVSHGDRYAFRLGSGELRPDPASRFQPNGVHEPSEVVDPRRFCWTDSRWRGVRKQDLVIYELHLGAFSTKGTFSGAIERLAELRDLGVTAVELLPVAQCPGRWNWGYDGVNLFAVSEAYGGPDWLKQFVDACHSHGLAVILDVVYNHVGPEGNYLAEFAPYFSEEHRTPWGEAFGFDGPYRLQVRDYIVQNVIRWLKEYHLDGLRLDAVHFMHDHSTPHILDEIRSAVTNLSQELNRELHLIAESNVYDPGLLAPQDSREPYDAAWSDCIMHSIYSHGVPKLRLTDREYRGASDIAQALRHGCLYVHTGNAPRRVDSSPEPAASNRLVENVESQIIALQTHDSVGNHPHGQRIHQLTSRAYQRAAAPLILLYPSLPMIFMGEEVASPAPFRFFADFLDPGLRQAVDTGRAAEYPHHEWDGAILPSDERAFRHANCSPQESDDHSMWCWYRDLLQLRKRGIREQWLQPDAFQVTSSQANSAYALSYKVSDNEWVVVCSYLRGDSDQTCPPLRLSEISEVLLMSEAAKTGTGGTMHLAVNQAVVYRSAKRLEILE